MILNRNRFIIWYTHRRKIPPELAGGFIEFARRLAAEGRMTIPHGPHAVFRLQRFPALFTYFSHQPRGRVASVPMMIDESVTLPSLQAWRAMMDQPQKLCCGHHADRAGRSM